MSGDRSPLAVGVGGDIDPERELGLRCPHRIAVVHRTVGVELLAVVTLGSGRVEAHLPGDRDHAPHTVAVHRRFEYPQVREVGTDHLLRPATDPVDLDVIGVAVAAVPVVDREHVGARS